MKLLQAESELIQFNLSDDYLLKILLRWDNILEDFINQLKLLDKNTLQKHLLVQFEGECGQDNGISREFFYLLTIKLFFPVFGPFELVNDGRFYWFHHVPSSNLQIYHIVGIIIALPIRFPNAFYKKTTWNWIEFK